MCHAMTDRRLTRVLPIERWPTRDEAQQSRWFSPIQLGARELSSRTWVPAMVPWRATPEGEVTDAVLAWYERFAQGHPGVIVVEATGIRDVPSGPLLRAGADRFVPGLKRLVDVVHRASQGRTQVFIQLIDFLSMKRRPTRESFFTRFLQVTPALRGRLESPWQNAPEPEVRAHLLTLSDAELQPLLTPREWEALQFGARQRVTDLEDPQVRELPRVLPGLFADAAARCVEAGFDGIELHFAHAYTMASFLSARNTRTDGYGGAREHRVRLPLEVVSAVRERLGTRVALGCRYLADEIITGGSSLDDAQFFALEFARAGLDFISLSRGGKFEDAKQPRVGQAAYPYTGPSGHECMPTPMIGAPGPWGRNVSATAQIKRALVDAGFTTPVVACGGISSFWQAEQILAQGQADIVASARQSLADPDWFLKVLHGRGGEVRRCFFTNYCEGLDQSHEVVTCQRWDRAKGLPDDATALRTSDGRRMVAPAWSAT